jgi:hypothetical protein
LTFADEKAKQTTRRFMLVQLSFAKDLSDVLEAEGGGVFSTTFDPPVTIESVKDGANDLTETTASSPSSSQFYYDEDSGLLRVNLGIEGSALYVVATCSLRITSRETGVVASRDPTDTATAKRLWEPRLATDPVIRESVKNAFAGVFTLEEISIEIKNEDRWLQQFVSSVDSLRDKEVLVWLCLQDVTNIRRVFTGKSRSLQLAPSQASIDVYDSFSLLDQGAYFGDTAGEAIYLKNGGTFTGLDPTRQGLPCRLIAAKFSRYKQKPGGVWPYYPSVVFDGESSLDPEFLEEAHCIDYSSTISTSNNRQWGLCRTLDGLRNIVVGTRSGVPVNSGSLTGLTFSAAVWATMDLQIGDTVSFATGHYGRVVKIESVLTTKQVWFRTTATVSPAIVNATAITVHPAVELVIVDSAGVAYYPIYGRDYTITDVATTGGNVFHRIDFVSSFESVTWNSIDWFGELNEAVAPGIDPGRHKVFFKVRPATTNLSHANFLKTLCESAGLTVNAASFTAADAAFSANALLSVPWFDQTDYGTYRDYAEGILESTLGYLSVNDSGEVVYELVSTVSPTATRDDNLVVRDSATCSMDFNDIVVVIIAYNPHDYSDETTIGASSATEEGTLGIYVHGVLTQTQMRHYLDTIATRLADIIEIRSRAIITYNWTTETEDLDTSIADDLTLESDQVLGGVGSVAVKVIRLEKSTKGVAVTAVQIQGV